MSTPAKINFKRLILSGLVAGFIVDLITGFVNSTLLKSTMQVWSDGMANHIHPPTPSSQIVLWTVMGLIDGFLGVWIYVATKTRLGRGPKTAFHAGLIVWIIGRLCVAFDLIALGVFPLEVMIGQGLLGLAAILPGVLLGAWVYRD